VTITKTDTTTKAATTTKRRPAPGVEHRRLRLLPEELYAIIPLLDEHRFSPYVRALLIDAVRGNIPRDLQRVPPIAAALEKNTCLAVERALLAEVRECAKSLGLSLNHFLRALIFFRDIEDVKLRVPPEQFLHKAA
jgi:hypothetical protein